METEPFIPGLIPTSIPDEQKQAAFDGTINQIMRASAAFDSNFSFRKELEWDIRSVYMNLKAGNWLEINTAFIRISGLINAARQSKNATRLQTRLAIVPFVYALVLLGLQWLIAKAMQAPIGFAPSDPYFAVFWAGFAGASVMVWWGLVKHATELTFDPNFRSWYYLKPLLGGFLGLFSVLTLKAGFTALGAPSDANLTGELTYYVIAFLAGFSERFFMRLIDRVTQAVFGGEAATAGSTPAQRPSSSSSAMPTIPPPPPAPEPPTPPAGGV